MATRNQFEPAKWLEEQGWRQYDPYTHLPVDRQPIGGAWHFRKQAGRVVSEALVLSDGTVAICCPRCRRESFNREDVLRQFCVGCGWHDTLEPEPLPGAPV